MKRRIIQTAVIGGIVGGVALLLSVSTPACDGDEHSERYMLCAVGNDSAFRKSPAIMPLGSDGWKAENPSFLGSIIRGPSTRPTAVLTIHDDEAEHELVRLREYIEQSKYDYYSADVMIAVHPDFLDSAEAFKKVLEERGGEVLVRVPEIYRD